MHTKKLSPVQCALSYIRTNPQQHGLPTEKRFHSEWKKITHCEWYMHFNGHQQRNTDLTADGPKTHIVLLLFQYRTPVVSRKIRKPCYILEVFKNGKNTNVLNSTPSILRNSQLNLESYHGQNESKNTALFYVRLRGVMLFNSRLNKQHLKFYPAIH